MKVFYREPTSIKRMKTVQDLNPEYKIPRYDSVAAEYSKLSKNKAKWNI